MKLFDWFKPTARHRADRLPEQFKRTALGKDDLGDNPALTPTDIADLKQALHEFEETKGDWSKGR
jgi:hypothetical protein